ncbi:hypothetical protein B4144_0188 [Bacillus atrophaeus]|nr:hypothetical protein B4144_0188 [Bacillus atrophaeus]
MFKESPPWFKEILTAVILINQPGGIRRNFDNLHPRQLSRFSGA